MSVCPTVLELRFYGCYHPCFCSDLLIEAITEYKPFRCKQTLPYSGHQYNLTFVICYKHPSKDSGSYIQFF